jgi:hypothetical protein
MLQKGLQMYSLYDSFIAKKEMLDNEVANILVKKGLIHSSNDIVTINYTADGARVIIDSGSSFAVHKEALQTAKIQKDYNTQTEFVLNKLKEVGYISRNQALSNYITRLGAIIDTLKRKGYKIEGAYNKGGLYANLSKKDYIYRLVK